MIKKSLLLSFLILLGGVNSAWADTATDEQYTAAIANITDGNYRIYALGDDGTTKYYLKRASNFNNSNDNTAYADFTTDAASAATYTISQYDNNNVVAKSWKITEGSKKSSKTYYFTNPGMSSGSINNQV